MADLLAVAGLAGRIALGLVFVLAALEKIRHWRLLKAVIGNYRILPEAWTGPAAWLLPPGEFVLGTGLLAGIAPKLFALGAILLLLVFAGAMALNIRRGRDHIDCGCHQSFLRQALSPVLVTRNLVLAALLLPSFMAAAPIGVAGIATACFAGLAFFIFHLTLNTLAALPGTARPASGASP